MQQAGKAKIPKLQLRDFALPAEFLTKQEIFKMQITLRIGKLLFTVKIDVRAILALIMLFSQ